MKIGIDCRKFYDLHANTGAGIERYAYHLVKTLLNIDQQNDYVLFFHSDLSPETIHRVKANHPRVKIVKLFRASSKLPLWNNHLMFSRILKKEKLDVTIFPANIIPLFYHRRSVLVVHDLAIYIYPKWFPEKQWFSTRVLVPWSIRRASLIVAISQSTKLDLLRLFKVKEEKVNVIYPGVIVKDDYLDEEVNKIRKKFDIRGGYLLFIGTIEPRKNILNLIKAFSNYIFENEDSEVCLVLAGMKGWKFKQIFQQLNEINQRLVGARIKYIGKISNRERNILLKNCQAFVFPSYYEGFGFPVIEAMALGSPVVTGDNSSLKEVAAECAYLVQADDANDIRRGIKAVLEDKILRQRLVSRGRARAAEFQWGTTARKFMILLNKK